MLNDEDISHLTLQEYYRWIDGRYLGYCGRSTRDNLRQSTFVFYCLKTDQSFRLDWYDLKYNVSKVSDAEHRTLKILYGPKPSDPTP